MDNGQITSWFEDLLPRLKQASVVEDEFLKFAHEQNMTPALLEKLAQVYNTAKAVNFLKQADDNGISRGENFKVLDVDSLVDGYTKIATLKKEPATTKSAAPRTLSEVLDGCGGRAPHEVDWSGDDPSTDEYEEVKMASAEQQKLAEFGVVAHNIDVTDQAVFNTKEDVRDLLGSISDDIMKVASDVTFKDLEADAIRVGGGAFKAACDRLHSFMEARGIPQERTETPSKPGFIRHQETFAKLATVQDKINWLEMAGEFREHLEKQAALPAPPKEKEKKDKKDKDPFGFNTPTVSRGGKQPTTLEALQEGKGNAPKALLQNTVKDIFGAGAVLGNEAKKIPGRAADVSKFVMGQSDNVETIADKFRQKWKGDQEFIDEDYDQTARAAMLQEFLITDPILSEADPDQVLEMYDSLAKFSPELSKDKNVMRVALRSAIQHDGMAPQDLRQFLDTEHSIQVNQSNQDAAKQRLYYNKRKGEKPTKHDQPEQAIR